MTLESRPALASNPFRQLSTQFLATTGIYCVLLGMLVAWAIDSTTLGADLPLKPSGVVVAIIGAAASILGVAALTLGWRGAAPSRWAGFHLPVIASLIVVSIGAAALEIATRVLARPHPLGWHIGARVLVPYDWSAAKAFNKALLARSRDPSSYYVESLELGWTIGPSRRSSNGMYFSSAEGLRSSRQGEELFSTAPATRIAIFGDSFAFSEEVPFEHSLNVHLERRLGGGAQVLTFGVPGYGIGQAVLRFEREAARWKPAVSVLQFITNDINRIGDIYLFNKPNWAYPFVKPRFVYGQGGLQQLPTQAAEEVFGHASIFDLPHLELDTGFREDKWRDFLGKASYALRFLASHSLRAPPTRPPGAPLSNEQIAVSLIERFVSGARAIGSVPMVVFFPIASDIDGQDAPLSRYVISALVARGIDVVDPSECMKSGGGVDELIVDGGGSARPFDAATLVSVGAMEFGGGGHYSDAGNARMAHCLAPLLEQRLASRTSVQTDR